jgi:nucleoside 2-deoxyribosyltransferase
MVECDAVLAILEGYDVDSGTAAAFSKPIVAARHSLDREE